VSTPEQEEILEEMAGKLGKILHLNQPVDMILAVFPDESFALCEPGDGHSARKAALEAGPGSQLFEVKVRVESAVEIKLNWDLS